MSRTFKDDPLWVKENRAPSRTLHRHWRHGCDDPREFASGQDVHGRMCMRRSVLARKGYLLNGSKFYARDGDVRRKLNALVSEWNTSGDCDDSEVPTEGKNASLPRSGWFDIG